MSAVNPDDLVDGRYRILRRLGTGGMADVFLAHDEQLERDVALKLLHRRFAEDPGFVERFRREAQSAANLQHPNVVSVFDRGTWDGTYYIAMEYLPGRTLKQVIRQEAPLDAIRAIDITVQMLKATRFAHRRGVIHRDLKPQNVMIDDQDHVKVTDFGIARAGASDMTETGSIMGTAQYLSPEQAQGLAVAQGSDLYSIGVVLYELVTGRVPFDAEAAVTIALKHVSEAPVPPSRYNPEIPPALEQTTLWALNKDPRDRPADADQFINVLEGIRESLVAGGNGQVTASMAALSDGALGGAALGAAAGGALGAAGGALAAGAGGAGAGAAGAGAAGAGAAGAGPRPRVQLGDHSLTGPSTALHPAAADPAAAGLAGAAGAGAGAALAGGGAEAFGDGVPGGPNGDGGGIGPGGPGGAGGPDAPGARRKTRWQKTWPWLLGLLVLALIGGGVAAFLLTRPTNGTVPVVVNLTEQQATADVQNAGFYVTRLSQKSTSPEGQVIRQSPLGGTRARTGTTVELTISSGPGSTVVPAVVQLTQAQAKAQLHQAGLRVSRILTEHSNAIRKGEATRSVPAAGQSLPIGKSVVLYISSGPALITVPDVVGDTIEGAESALTQFIVHQTQQQTNSAPPGTVISQSPEGGAHELPGTAVSLVVAQAVPRVTVPNVVGQNLTHAAATLGGLGFRVTHTMRSTTNRAQNDQVASTTPAANRRVPQGSTVNLVVYRYSHTATNTNTNTATTPATNTSTNAETTPTTTTSTTPTTPGTPATPAPDTGAATPPTTPVTPGLRHDPGGGGQ